MRPKLSLGPKNVHFCVWPVFESLLHNFCPVIISINLEQISVKCYVRARVNSRRRNSVNTSSMAAVEFEAGNYWVFTVQERNADEVFLALYYAKWLV